LDSRSFGRLLQRRRNDTREMERRSFKKRVLQPSLYETFGITILEAIACGKPVITTSLPVLQEKVNPDIGILVPPRNAKALADAIEYILDHYQQYSSNKIAQYAKYFSHEAIGKKIDSIYKRVLCTKE
ncbi:MAG: glycosyltransferase, partial [Candidatus Ratteibacteria bacterium]